MLFQVKCLYKNQNNFKNCFLHELIQCVFNQEYDAFVSNVSLDTSR